MVSLAEIISVGVNTIVSSGESTFPLVLHVPCQDLGNRFKSRRCIGIGSENVTSTQPMVHKSSRPNKPRNVGEVVMDGS